MTGHAYNVTPIIEKSFMWHRADCECGQEFPRRQEQLDAALDGLDHVREMRGAKTRRQEIAEEAAAAAALHGGRRR